MQDARQAGDGRDRRARHGVSRKAECGLMGRGVSRSVGVWGLGPHGSPPASREPPESPEQRTGDGVSRRVGVWGLGPHSGPPASREPPESPARRAGDGVRRETVSLCPKIALDFRWQFRYNYYHSFAGHSGGPPGPFGRDAAFSAKTRRPQGLGHFTVRPFGPLYRAQPLRLFRFPWQCRMR